MPVKLFIAPRLKETKEDIRIIRTYEGAHSQSGTVLFKDLPKDYKFTGFVFVKNIEEADFVLAPQSIRKLDALTTAYLANLKRLAHEAGKRIVLFIGSDLSHRVHVEDVVAFKASEYASAKYPEEILMPSYTEDLREKVPFEPRHKGERPVVGFCGYADFPSLVVHARYVAKNTFLDAEALITGSELPRLYKRGIYYRRRAMAVLANDPRIETKFIVRSTFSGNTATSAIDPKQARREYIENVRDSDFVLCPKGDGNYSSRFYRALNMGRIPILIDTDMVLPFEKIIDYSKFILRVPYTDIDRLADIVADFYASLSDEEFQEMQNQARAAFAEYLRYDVFFNRAFPLLKEQGPGAF